MKSRSEIEKSMYYPYNPCYNRYSNRYRLEFNIIGKGRYIQVHRLREYYCTIWWRNDDYSTLLAQPKDDAAKMEQVYLSGERNRLKEVSKIRNDCLSYHIPYVTQMERQSGIKKLPVPNPKWDLPRNQSELAEYVQFLKTIEGVGQLCDSWGRPLSFSIMNRKLTCVSAGVDGKFGTKDDILLSKLAR
jgi:hypothetical protein